MQLGGDALALLLLRPQQLAREHAQGVLGSLQRPPVKLVCLHLLLQRVSLVQHHGVRAAHDPKQRQIEKPRSQDAAAHNQVPALGQRPCQRHRRLVHLDHADDAAAVRAPDGHVGFDEFVDRIGHEGVLDFVFGVAAGEVVNQFALQRCAELGVVVEASADKTFVGGPQHARVSGEDVGVEDLGDVGDMREQLRQALFLSHAGRVRKSQLRVGETLHQLHGHGAVALHDVVALIAQQHCRRHHGDYKDDHQAQHGKGPQKVELRQRRVARRSGGAAGNRAAPREYFDRAEVCSHVPVSLSCRRGHRTSRCVPSPSAEPMRSAPPESSARSRMLSRPMPL